MIARLIRAAADMHTLADAQLELIEAQRDLIANLRRQVQQTELQHTRISRDLIDQFLITLDQPELHNTAREGLWRARQEYLDHVARLEEHL